MDENEMIDINFDNNNNEINNMNNKPKKSKKGIVIIIILLLLVIGLCVFIYIKKDILFNTGNNINESNNVNNSNDSNNQTQNDNKPKELSSEEKKKILDIIGLTENGYPRLDSETINALNLTGGDYVDYSVSNIATHLINLNVGNHTVNDLDKESFGYFLVGVSKNKKEINANGDTNHPCYAGEGTCYGISESEYLDISKKYNIDSNLTSKMDKYNGYYIIHYFGTVLNPAKITDSLVFSYDNDYVIATYNISKSSVNSDKTNNPTINKKIVYRFKTLDDGSYYLYNFTITNI